MVTTALDWVTANIAAKPQAEQAKAFKELSRRLAR
jgi:hypothetical protein